MAESAINTKTIISVTSAHVSNLLVNDGHPAVEARSAAGAMTDLTVSQMLALHPRRGWWDVT